MRRLPIALIVVALALAAAAPAAVRADASNDHRWTQVWFPSRDGTMLRADVFLPEERKTTQRHPVILAIGPYFGRNSLNGGSNGPVMRFGDLLDEGKVFERGYAYVQVDSRGYGGSDGCNDFGGPGEQSDVEAAVNWAGKQRWSNGRVGMWGKSYDAWTQVMGLAENPVALKAAVIQSPLLETYRGMFMNGVHYEAGWYGTPSLYGAYDLAPVVTYDPAAEQVLYPAKGTATNPHCYAENIAMTTQPDHSLPYWQQRDVIADAARSRVPTLWSHGFNDVNTKPDNFLPVYSKLAGTKRAWFGQWDHVRGNQSNLVGRKGFMREAMHFFDRHLKGIKTPRYPAVEIQNGEGWWRSEKSWPPSDARRYPLRLRAGTYLDDVVNPLEQVGPDSHWTFTQRAPYDVHLAGEARFTATVTPQVPFANLIVQLYDFDGEEGRIVTRGAFRVPGAQTVGFNLYPQDWILRKGHRFGIRVTADDPWFMPTPTGGTVAIEDATLSAPFLRFGRRATLSGGPAAAQQRVGSAYLSNEQIESSDLRSSFPPRMKRPR